MWVLDFMEQRFHNMSPGDFESVFIKAGDSETKGGLRVAGVTGESLGSPLLWLSRNVVGKKWAMPGCVYSLKSKSHSERSELSQGCF